MKKLIAIAALLCLVACKDGGKTSAGSAASQAASPVKSEALVHTEAYPSEEILRAAGSEIKARRPLSSRYLERCWEKEQARPQVQEACALAWSIGAESSAKMAELCHALGTKQGRRSRNLALACFRHEPTLNSLNELELINIAELFKEEPLWVKVLPLRRWLKAHGDAARSSLPGLLAAFLPGWQERIDLDPLSYASALYALEALGVSEARQSFAQECSAQIEGVGLTRCWRHLSALADPSYREEFRAYSFPIPPRDLGWGLFSKSFPERAALLPLP